VQGSIPCPQFYFNKKGVHPMTIGEYIQTTDIITYNKLLKLCDFKLKKPISLGDSVENLMRHDSYKRVGRRIRQKQ